MPPKPGSAAAYEQAALDFTAAYEGDAEALARLNRHYGREFSHADLLAEIWRRNYAYRQRSSRESSNSLPLAEARLLLAQDAGHGSWEQLLAALATGDPPPAPFYTIDPREPRISPTRRLTPPDWDELFGVMKERGLTALDAHGQMTDDALGRLAGLDFVTSLNLGGSRELTDDGLRHLARMPQLERLDLSEYPGGKLTDAGLEVLAHLPRLRHFAMCWQSGISDRGAAWLARCPELEQVNLMGTRTGDGAVAALAGHQRLDRLSTGRLLTDAALPTLHTLPRFRDGAAPEARLLLDGPLSDAGLAALAGLAGVSDLDLFWHTDRLTSAGFAHLAALPHLRVLGCDGRLADDAALGHIGGLPRLERLRIQEAVATDDGFAALSRSATLQGIWGRVCPNFGTRGFLALSRLPALRSLGIGCAQVEDAALAALAEFPSLRELTPIGFTDAGFRHIGRCANLERLTCMYCRETGDEGTAHLEGLALRYYYAGLTQITDRGLELLSRLTALEQVDLYECARVTDAGLPHLARLPRLREVHLDGLPGVTAAGTRVFGSGVQVYYSA